MVKVHRLIFEALLLGHYDSVQVKKSNEATLSFYRQGGLLVGIRIKGSRFHYINPSLKRTVEIKQLRTLTEQEKIQANQYLETGKTQFLVGLSKIVRKRIRSLLHSKLLNLSNTTILIEEPVTVEEQQLTRYIPQFKN